MAPDELMAGAEVQANAIATVLESLPLRSSPAWLDVLAILLLAAVATVAGVRLKPLAAFGVAIGAGALYLVVAQFAFDADLVIAVVYPLLALIAAAVGILMLQYLREAFERQRVRFTFSRFVPEEVVDEVLEKGEEQLHLGGVRRECTVLFCDLRGFTSFAEDREPTDVVETLNRYLSEMTDAIMDHGGTLVSYMGDGIMAVFGAPIEQDDHADRAIAASREMLEVPPAGLLRLDARERPRRRLRDGDRAQQRRGDVGAGRLRTAHGVHDDRRHHEHGLAPGGDDERVRLPDLHRRLDPRGAPAE